MRHIYEVSLNERELEAIIKALRKAELPAYEHLATRLEAELWTPYHESVAAGRNR